MVPAAGRPAGLDRVLDSHRHVGGWLHFLRDGLRKTSISGINRRGRAPSHFQSNHKPLWKLLIAKSLPTVILKFRVNLRYTGRTVV